ncbi:hypothetical protein HYY74_03270 [Candidatus Woesearchaeota archaeon]|nr:hypothetical protein [Candidatus Woesearchaeota archaeon]
MPHLVNVNTALISVHDKTGVKYLYSELLKVNPDIRVISSGGTYAELANVNGKNLVQVSDYTGFPEMPSGLVKTLHPKVHGGILGNEGEAEFMRQHGIEKIDLVVVNLYPFKGEGKFHEARKNIDIGGVSLIEAGCKNFTRVAVLTDPSEYERFVSLLTENKGTDLKTRLNLAQRAAGRLSRYLKAISEYFEGLREGDI